MGTDTDPADRGTAAWERAGGTIAALLTQPASTAALIVIASSGLPDNLNFMLTPHLRLVHCPRSRVLAGVGEGPAVCDERFLWRDE